jgi:1-acyl-sn-glycerol-3-phosphate acyltransferase
VLDPIPADLPRDEFFQRVQAEIETASDRLYEEGRRELGLGPARTSETSLSKA